MSSGQGEARRNTVKTLLAEALTLPADRRAGFLVATCGPNADLLADVSSLLATFDEASDYFTQLTKSLLPAHAADHAISPTDPYGLIGRSVSDYHILEMLGGGGMGVVYRARHEKLDRLAALKFLPPHLSTDASAKARFLHEARAASTLDHPNVCTIYDVGESAAGQLFIAMAYYDGETLAEKLVRGPLGVGEALDVAVQVADGLAGAHARGIVHRDVKPANVLVTREGVAKLLDFGLATVAYAALAETDGAMGTVAYMSPEQASGERVDHRTDLWSLGVLVYELLAGRRPFAGDDDRALVHAVLHSTPAPPANPTESIPLEIVEVINRCLEKDPARRFPSAADLWMELSYARELLRVDAAQGRGTLDGGAQAPRNPIAAQGRGTLDGGAQAPRNPVAFSARGRGNPVPDARTRSGHVFVSYSMDAESDRTVADAVKEALSPLCDVILDDLPLSGRQWSDQVEHKLARADVLVLLLSEHSIHSEMIVAHVEASRNAESGFRPVLLPVRLATREPLVYPLSSYLSGVKEAYWEGPGDTPRLTSEIVEAVTRGSSAFSDTPPFPARAAPAPSLLEPHATAQPPRLEMPEGSMHPLSSFYVKRPEDDVALRAIVLQGVTITIKGPRQVGKSSLLIRTMEAARKLGKEVAFLDFQLFDRASLNDADLFFRQFCAWITDELDLEDRIDAYWKHPLSNGQRCSRYMERYVLRAVGRPVLLALDEVERVFDADFRSDFFSMLRSWHNDRAIKPHWKGLDLALVTSTEPYQLIENLNQSPFNVGEVVALGEFTAEQVTDLNERHGKPLTADQLQKLLALVGGHPYLIRRALYLIAGRRITIDALLRSATDEHGPFGDHLRHHLFRLQRQPTLVDGMRQILEKGQCDNDGIFWRLRGAGLVRRNGRDVFPNSRLYADFFSVHLND